jgi:hypothetical protein
MFFFPLATPHITDTRSRRLPDSTILGVGDSPYQRHAESATLRLNNTGSQRLSTSLIRRVDDSPYHQYSEFSFKKFNSRLSVSVMQGGVEEAVSRPLCSSSCCDHIIFPVFTRGSYLLLEQLIFVQVF